MDLSGQLLRDPGLVIFLALWLAIMRNLPSSGGGFRPGLWPRPLRSICGLLACCGLNRWGFLLRVLFYAFMDKRGLNRKIQGRFSFRENDIPAWMPRNKKTRRAFVSLRVGDPAARSYLWHRPRFFCFFQNVIMLFKSVSAIIGIL